ncbi:hypothetical protein C8J57DRAFT_1588409 [Mycena rebaudengoi]|nr:hypothetical protein C8J57DRAFT_1588409 [Mycena rebaudengoi]
MTFIPQELVDAIIVEIDRSDVPTLRSCALAAKVFVRQSQKMLFWSISFDVAHVGPTGTVKMGHTLLRESPHLAHHVKCLYTDIFLEGSDVDQRSLVDILRWLPNVERLHLNGDYQSWSGLLSDLRLEISSCLTRYPLKEFGLENIFNIPSPLLFTAASALPLMSLSRVHMDPREPQDIGTTLHLEPITRHLRALIVSGDNSVLEFLLYPRTPRYIDQVQMLMINISHLRRGQMISAVAQTVRHLVLELQGNDLISWVPQMLALPQQPPLRNLTFRVKFLDYGTLRHIFSAILSLCPQFPSLHAVAVVFDTVEQTTENEYSPFLDVFFRRVDHCLSACGSLRRMCWMRAFQSASAASLQEISQKFTAFLEGQLPRLHAAGILHFDWNFPRDDLSSLGFTFPLEA